MQKGMFSNTEGYVLKYRRACSQMQKGMFSNTERHVLKYRKACSQIQKGPFFCLNTHASHSCGAKQIYIKIKYSSPSHASHSPPPRARPLQIHPQPSPSPHTFRSQPTHLLPPSHSPSVRSPLSFRPQPTPRPSPTRSPLSVTPRTCSYCNQSYKTSHKLPGPLVLLSTCHIPLSLLAYNLFSRPLLNPSTYNVTHRTCSPVTMSPLAYNLLTRLPINSSTCPLLTELVHLLPCLLIQLTCSLVHSLIRLLVNYFYLLTFLSVLVQNTATLILPFLSPLFNIEMITISKTSY